MTITKSWRKAVFGDEPFLRPETRIRRQIAGIERMLELKHRARVLDLGCGAGSQTIELARRRFRVVGMDASSESFAPARQRAREENLSVHFVANDLRRIPYEGEFDAVINLRNPIGCFLNERDNERCLKAVSRSLRRGGKLIMDLLNREWLIRRLGTPTKAEAKETAFDLTTGRLDCREFSARGGASDRQSSNLRVYSLTEIIRLISDAGLEFRQAWGSFDAKPYGVDTQRMIVIAEKTARHEAPPRPEEDFPRALRIKGRGEKS